VNHDNSPVVTITVTSYLWAPSSGDHFIYMWRHLQAATLVTVEWSHWGISIVAGCIDAASRLV